MSGFCHLNGVRWLKKPLYAWKYKIERILRFLCYVYQFLLLVDSRTLKQGITDWLYIVSYNDTCNTEENVFISQGASSAYFIKSEKRK